MRKGSRMVLYRPAGMTKRAVEEVPSDILSRFLSTVLGKPIGTLMPWGPLTYGKRFYRSFTPEDKEKIKQLVEAVAAQPGLKESLSTTGVRFGPPSLFRDIGRTFRNPRATLLAKILSTLGRPPLWLAETIARVPTYDSMADVVNLPFPAPEILPVLMSRAGAYNRFAGPEVPRGLKGIPRRLMRDLYVLGRQAPILGSVLDLTDVDPATQIVEKLFPGDENAEFRKRHSRAAGGARGIALNKMLGIYALPLMYTSPYVFGPEVTPSSEEQVDSGLPGEILEAGKEPPATAKAAAAITRLRNRIIERKLLKQAAEGTQSPGLSLDTIMDWVKKNPHLAYGLAGGAIGGGLGFLSGSNEKNRWRNALLGTLGGAGLGAAAPWAKDYFFPQKTEYTQRQLPPQQG